MTATELKRIITRHYPNADAGVSTHILRACGSTGLPLSYGLALVERESGFQNVFGHDPVRNPVKGGRVTLSRYVYYRTCRRAGLGMQGVGYTQLTWFSYQDEADRIGGCWKAYPNLCVGFRLLRDHVHALGREHGAAAYNGTGTAAAEYGRAFVTRQDFWHKEVTK